MNTFCDKLYKVGKVYFPNTKVSEESMTTEELKELSRLYLERVGGKENVEQIEACITRIRLIVKDVKKVREKDIKKLGAIGLKIDNKKVHIVIGIKAELIVEEMKRLF